MQENLSAQKVALITGAARRIGAEISRTLHAAQINVVLHYHQSEKAAMQLCAELNNIRSASAQIICADLTKTGHEQIFIQEVWAKWQRLDIVVNNASKFYKTPFGKATQLAWDDLINSNLRSPFFLAQASAPLLAANQGIIVNITDIHANHPLSDYAIYCLSKNGLSILTKILAKELGPHVRVNAVAPGSILWPEGENTLSEIDKQKIIQKTILQRAGVTADIAKAVLFFVRDADYVTGQTLIIDGGRTLSV